MCKYTSGHLIPNSVLVTLIFPSTCLFYFFCYTIMTTESTPLHKKEWHQGFLHLNAHPNDQLHSEKPAIALHL